MRRVVLLSIALVAVAAAAVTLSGTLSPPRAAPKAPGRSSPSPEPSAEIPNRLVEEESPIGRADRDPDAPTGVVFGTVVEDVTGSPVDDAEVVIWAGRWRGRAECDARGGYVLREVPVGRPRLWVRSLRLVDPPARLLDVEAGRRTRADIRLEGGASVVGTVADATTDEPLAGIVVKLLGSDRKVCETGADGRYRIDGVRTGVGVLETRGEHYPSVRETVTVPEGGQPVTHDLRLDRGASVRGVVLLPGGGPAGGAEVRTGRDAHSVTKTAADGSFVLSAVRPGRSVQVVADLEGYVPARSDRLTLERGKETGGLRLLLREGGTLRGIVVREDGRPAEGLSVAIQHRQARGRSGFRRSVPTDAQGAFTASPVPAGEYVVTARLPGSLPARVEARVEVPGPPAEMRLVLRDGESIAGAVHDGGGQPRPGVAVYCRLSRPSGGSFSQDRTDHEGRFRLSGLEPGKYRVSVWSGRGGHTVSVEAASGTSGLVITLPAPGAVSGTVVLPSGEPATSFSVTLRGGVGRAVGHEAVRTEEGRFRIEGIAPGRYSLTASSPDGFAPEHTGVDVVSGEEVSGLVLVLMPGAVIGGRLLTHDGSPVEGAKVTLRAEDRTRRTDGTAVTGPEGRFTHERLRPGSYTVTARSPDSLAVVRQVEAAAGAELDLELRLPGRGSVRVQVVDVSGAPVAGAVVRLSSPGNRIASLPRVPFPTGLSSEEKNRWYRQVGFYEHTDEGGVYSRKEVPSGRLIVRVTKTGYASGETTTDVAVGETTDVRLVLLKEGERR